MSCLARSASAGNVRRASRHRGSSGSALGADGRNDVTGFADQRDAVLAEDGGRLAGELKDAAG